MLLGLSVAGLLGTAPLLIPVVAMGATTALVMGGTSVPLRVPQQSQESVDGYVYDVNGTYINHPGANCDVAPDGCRLLGLVTPEEFVPVNGTLTFNQSVQDARNRLNGCLRGADCEVTHLTTPVAPGGTGFLDIPVGGSDTIHVFGYSQSATIVTLVKRDLAENPPEGNPTITFDVIGNPNRPSGGFLARGPQGLTIPGLDVTFFGPTPTDTEYQTDDYSRQYDGWSDGPVNPLNLLADLNALLGIALLHGDYLSDGVGEPILQDEYGDTSYYLIPTGAGRLPLVSWLDFIPYVGPFVASVLDAPLRVLVETAYDRESSPGEAIGWNVFYLPSNPLKIPINLAIAIPTGWDDAISQAAGDPDLRPLGTEPAGPYGVGGPSVTRETLSNDEDDEEEGATLAADSGDSPSLAKTTDDAVSAPEEPAAETPDDAVDAPEEPAETQDADLTSISDATDTAPPKERKPFGANLPKLGDLAPSLKGIFGKADKDDSSQEPEPSAAEKDDDKKDAPGDTDAADSEAA